jgi:AcrR family transcriptional regulator
MVLAAAREIADADGIEQLTMRRLADALGVTHNAPYSYFATKTELLDSLLDSVLAEVPTPDPDSVAWRDGLILLMTSTRRVLLAHPGLVSSYLARPSTGPNAIRLGEVTLELLRRGGLEGQRAVHALRALLIFSLGFVAFERPRLDDPDPEARSARGRARFAGVSRDELPNVRRAARQLARHPDDAEFRAGLSWLLDGIAGAARA